ncbi:hypothetical protein EC82524_2847A, partial [Escherichia coli 8.2524]
MSRVRSVDTTRDRLT